MQGYLKRTITRDIIERLKNNPVVAILGPRQCGKSTLAREVLSSRKDAIYLDLEKPSDLNKLNEPEIFFNANRRRLICLDEIQRKPDLFPLIRSIVDENRDNGQLLVLGSASRDLVQQSSETLAGRISYCELTPFVHAEVAGDSGDSGLRKLWLRGGFPRSYLAGNDPASHQWRMDYIRTFLERDIPLAGFSIPLQSMRRLWNMCAHLHGQVLNASKLGDSLGTSYHTARSYIDILESTFMLRVLRPWAANLKKRLVKSPKIYVRDSGILHALLGIETYNDLLGHPVFGASWEGLVLENVISSLPRWEAGFYRTSSGTEIDLVLGRGRKLVAVECKASKSPEIGKGFGNALNDLGIKEAWIIAPVDESYMLTKTVRVAPMGELINELSDEVV
jgi:hypothetical protein